MHSDMKKSFIIILASVFILSSCFERKSLTVTLPSSPAPQVINTGVIQVSNTTWTILAQDNNKTQPRVDISETENAVHSSIGSTWLTDLKWKEELWYFWGAMQYMWPMYKDDKYIYDSFKSFPYIDVNSLEIVKMGSWKEDPIVYLKDKNGIYFWPELQKIEGFIQRNFRYIWCPREGYWGIINCFSTDNENVYFNNQKITGADPKTFNLIQSWGTYSKDRNNVYYDFWDTRLEVVVYEKVDWVDPKSFVYLTGEYPFLMKDNLQIYVHWKAIRWVDLTSFKYLWWELNAYSKDKNNIYINDHILKNADISTFEIIWSNWHGGDYTKDKNNVYFNGEIIKWAVSKTFKLTPYNKTDEIYPFVSDERCVYEQWECKYSNEK